MRAVVLSQRLLLSLSTHTKTLQAERRHPQLVSYELPCFQVWACHQKLDRSLLICNRRTPCKARGLGRHNNPRLRMRSDLRALSFLHTGSIQGINTMCTWAVVNLSLCLSVYLSVCLIESWDTWLLFFSAATVCFYWLRPSLPIVCCYRLVAAFRGSLSAHRGFFAFWAKSDLLI